MAQFSDMLVYLRKRERMSQQELADVLGVSRSAIGMYETGKREPDLETLEAIADHFNVDMNTLTGKGAAPVPDNSIPYVRGRRLPVLLPLPIKTVSPTGGAVRFSRGCKALRRFSA